MSLQYLSTSQIQNLLTCAWQNDLGTTLDPANGKWYTNGPNNDGIGLYGGLTDAVPNSIDFDLSAAVYTPTGFIADTVTLNNSDGLLQSPTTVTLTYGYTISNSSTQSMTESISLGTQFTIPFGASASAGGVEFSINLSFSSTSETSTSTSSTITYNTTQSESVPDGQIYEVVLNGVLQSLSVPYTVPVTVTGTTETWFADRVNGHYNYSTNAAGAFNWIATYNCAGSQSSEYSSSGAAGIVVSTGTLTASQSADWSVSVANVTSQVLSGAWTPRDASGKPNPLPPDAVIVRTYKPTNATVTRANPTSK